MTRYSVKVFVEPSYSVLIRTVTFLPLTHSRWYDLQGWLGVKSQLLTYLPLLPRQMWIFCFCFLYQLVLFVCFSWSMTWSLPIQRHGSASSWFLKWAWASWLLALQRSVQVADNGQTWCTVKITFSQTFLSTVVFMYCLFGVMLCCKCWGVPCLQQPCIKIAFLFNF